MQPKTPTEKVLNKLLKEPFTAHTVLSLAKMLDMDKQGVWKVLNELLKKNLIKRAFVRNDETNSVAIKIDWSVGTEKALSLALSQERPESSHFAELENKVLFLIQDNDNLLAVINKKNFAAVEKSAPNIIIFTEMEFSQELKKRKYIEMIKNGIILYGQENYIQFIRKLTQS